MKKQTTQKIALTGLMAALSYVVFTFLQIKIPLPGGDATVMHFNIVTQNLSVNRLKIGKITIETDTKKVALFTTLAAAGGLLFNVIFDPLVGYFYKLVILGKPAAELTLAWNVAATSINAVTSTIVSVLIYMALRPALKKAGLFFTLSK